MAKENGIIERVRLLIEFSRLSVNSYAKALGVNLQTLYKCVGGRVPAVELLQKILIANPSVSARWLLTGEGEAAEPDVKDLREQIREKDGQIRELIGKIR